MQPDALQISQFDCTANEPNCWSNSARTLRAAAQAIRNARETVDHSQFKTGDAIPDIVLAHPCELMLESFAVECLMKALWLKQGNKLAANGRLALIPGAGAHDLVQLADRTKFTLDEFERDTIKRLSLFSESPGRYPVPRNWANHKGQTWRDGGWASPIFWRSPNDYSNLEAVVQRLADEIKTTIAT